MSTQVQFRRGNTAQTSTFTGAVAEITVDTDKETIVVHDGSTAGGFPLARESALSANLAFTQAAFSKANTANVTAETAYAWANTINVFTQSSFTKANSANILAQAAFDKANAALANTGTLVTANGLTTYSFANTTPSTSNTTGSIILAGGLGVKGNIYADAVYDSGVEILGFAQAAFDKANSAAQQTFLTFSANGTNVVADANNDTVTLTPANGIGITANATTDTITINLNPTGVTSGTYGSASIVPVFVVDAQGRLSSVTNTTIAIAASAVTSGTFAFARGGTNATSYTTGTLLTSNGTAIVSLANTGTAATYANASHVPVITTDAYGRVSAVTNTLISITSAQHTGVHNFALGGTNASSYTTGSLLTSNGTAIVSLANTGTAGTYANATHVPVITTDAYGRVSAVTNTAISFPVTSVAGVTGAVSNTQLINGIIAVDGSGSGLDADLLDGLQGTSYANATFTQAAFDKANNALANTGGSITGDVTITGNLTVVGQQVYANTQTVLIKDNIITLNAAIDQASAPSANAGLEIDRGSSANVYLLWNENSDVWQFTNDGTTYFTIADAATVTSAFSKANTANIIADSAYAFANTVNIKTDAAFAFSNTVNIKTDAAFTRANAANVLAQAAFDKANTDTTSISVTPGVYGNASAIPSITVAANGRISAITTESFTAASIGDALALSIALG